MDIPNQYFELVRDALYARDAKQVGCLVFNNSSEKVQEIGLPILPAIEQIIRDEVMSRCPTDPRAQREVFPGIGNLVVDYLQIVKKEGQLERAAAFVSLLEGAVLVEAIRFISMGWGHVIPEPFVKTVEAVANSGSPEERDIANWALNWHRNNPNIDSNGAVISERSLASPVS